jgi:hypothetical protein
LAREYAELRKLDAAEDYPSNDPEATILGRVKTVRVASLWGAKMTGRRRVLMGPKMMGVVLEVILVVLSTHPVLLIQRNIGTASQPSCTSKYSHISLQTQTKTGPRLDVFRQVDRRFIQHVYH